MGKNWRKSVIFSLLVFVLAMGMGFSSVAQSIAAVASLARDNETTVETTTTQTQETTAQTQRTELSTRLTQQQTQRAPLQSPPLYAPQEAPQQEEAVEASAIQGTVWDDANDNGLQDTDEEGINEVKVELQKKSDSTWQTIAEQKTKTELIEQQNKQGQYAFSNLGAGTYRVKIVLEEDATKTIGQKRVNNNPDATNDSDFRPDDEEDPDRCCSDEIVLDGTNIEQADGALAPVYDNKISGFVWADKVNNGVYEPNPADESLKEWAIEGWTIYLLKASDKSIVAETQTDASGIYTFENIEPGEYVVKPFYNTPDTQEYQRPRIGLVGQNKINNTGTTDVITVTADSQTTDLDIGMKVKPGYMLQASYSIDIGGARTNGPGYNWVTAWGANYVLTFDATANGNTYRIYGSHTANSSDCRYISVPSGVNVTILFDNVTMNNNVSNGIPLVNVATGAAATINMQGTNHFTNVSESCFAVTTNGSLVIEGPATANMTTGGTFPIIGRPYGAKAGQITINNLEINSTVASAPVVLGSEQSFDGIIFNNVRLNSTSTNSAAGYPFAIIGGSRGTQKSGDITITGGSIIGEFSRVGIGTWGTTGGSMGTITMNGDAYIRVKIYANPLPDGRVAIGGSNTATCDKIVINGGDIVAAGGRYGTKASEIQINGGQIITTAYTSQGMSGFSDNDGYHNGLRSIADIEIRRWNGVHWTNPYVNPNEMTLRVYDNGTTNLLQTATVLPNTYILGFDGGVGTQTTNIHVYDASNTQMLGILVQFDDYDPEIQMYNGSGAFTKQLLKFIPMELYPPTHSNVTKTSADLTSTGHQILWGTYDNAKFEYALNQGMTNSLNNKPWSSYQTPSVTEPLTGLTSNTKYYYRTSFKLQEIATYIKTQVLSSGPFFVTLPDITSFTSSNITTNAGTVSGTIGASANSNPITGVEIFYDTDPGFGSATKVTLAPGSGTASGTYSDTAFTLDLTSLAAGTTYYVKAVVYNSDNHDSPNYGGKDEATLDLTPGYVIKTYSWLDSNRDGLDNNGETVMPTSMKYTLQKDNSGTWVDVGSPVTQPTGAQHTFAVSSTGTYRVKYESVGDTNKYPTLEGGDSNINGQGYTGNLVIDSSTPQISTKGGFVSLNLPGPNDFKKEVWNGSSWVNTLTVTDVTQTISYQVSAQLPSDTVGYNSIMLKDILPSDLRLANNNVNTDVRVKVNGTPVAAVDGTLAFDGTDTVSYTFANGYNYVSLANALITMEVDTKLKNTSYPLTSIVNKAQLFINNRTPEEKNEPPVNVKGEIKGTVWNDTATKDDLFAGADSGIDGVTVELFKEVGAGTWVSQGTKVTSGGGKYSFTVDMDANYKVKVPTMVGSDGLVTQGSAANASHIGKDGYSDVLAVGHTATDKDHTVNAGYVEAAAISGFVKQVWNGTAFVDTAITVTDLSQIIEYQVTVPMPSSTSGIVSMEITDTLPTGLVLATGTLSADVKVLDESDTDVTATYGTLSQSGSVIKYEIKTSEISNLAGKTLKLQLKTKIDTNGTLPTSVKNEAQLKINNGSPLDPPDEPEVGVKGTITGQLWKDEAPLNNSYDAGTDTKLNNVTVELYESNGTTFIASTTTGTDGEYKFEVTMGEGYKVKVPTMVGTDGLVGKGAAALSSHVYTNGYSDVMTIGQTATTKDKKVNAGYAQAGDFAGFKKEIWDGIDWSSTNISISDLTQVIRYQITVPMPSSMSGIVSLEIEDDLPAGLLLATGTLNADVKVLDESDTDVTATYGTLSMVGTTIKYTIHPLQISSLAGKTLKLQLNTVVDTSGTLPTSVKNEAQLNVNSDPPVTPPEEPEAEIKGTITGQLWKEVTINDLYDNGTDAKLNNVTVELYESNGTTFIASTTTGTDGKYKFEVDMSASYIVKFPTMVGTDGLVTKGSAPLASHANLNGKTDLIAIGDTVANKDKTANAGYTAASAISGFVKQVWNGTAFVDTAITVTDLSQIIEYQVTVPMPSSTSGIVSMEITDTLPTGLLLATGTLSADVKVLDESDTDVTATYGTLSMAATTIKYTVNPLQISSLAGKTLKLQLKTKIDTSGTLPASVKNEAQLKINNGSPLDPPDEPEVGVKGTITGQVWKDEAPLNNSYDAGTDTKLNNVTVELYKSDGTTLITSTATGADGKYKFEVDMSASYIIKFPTMVGTDGLVTKGSAPLASHANLNGKTDLIVIGDTVASKDKTANAGYTAASAISGFVKQVWNGTAFVDTAITVTDLSQIIEYQVTVPMPSSTSGIVSMEITDTLPTGLLLATGTLSADVKVLDESDTDVTATYGTLSMAATTIKYTVNPLQISSLAGKTLKLQLKTKIDTSGTLPASVKNEAQLKINNGSPLDPPDEPEVGVKGTITGQLWKEVTINDLYDNGTDTKLAGIQVKVYEWDGTNIISSTEQVTTTNSDGQYKFELDMNRNYKILLPTMTNGATLIAKGSAVNASHVVQTTGYSDPVAVGNTNLTKDKVVNGGYVELEMPSLFTKKVWDGTSYQDSAVITDNTAPLQFLVEVSMPSSLSGYNSLEIKDALPAALDLWNPATPENDVTVKVGSTDVTTDATWGTLSYNTSTNTISYVFDAARLNDTDLGGQTVTMKISSKIVDMDALPIENKAEYVANNDSNPPETPDPEINFKGIIIGLLWEDSNSNGQQDGGEPPVTGGVTVTLQKKDGSNWTDIGTTTSDAITGSYQFEVDYDAEYRIQFPGRTPKVFTLQHVGAWQTDSDADVYGYTNGMTVNATNQHYEHVDAGYSSLMMPGTFNKMLVNGNGINDPTVNSVTITEPGQVVTFKVKAQMNDMVGYHAMKFTDALDGRLEYVDAQIWLNGTTNITGMGTLHYNSGTHTVTFSFNQPVDRTTLANQEIEMLLHVKVKNDVTDFSNITNVAKLRVNDQSEIDTPDNPEIILNFGFVRGYVFVDENGNGLRDAQSHGLSGAAVELLSWDGTNWNHVANSTTNGAGEYNFGAKGLGDYAVRVTSHTDHQLTLQNANGQVLDGTSSDANVATKRAEFDVSAVNRHRVATVGLIAPVTPTTVTPTTVAPTTQTPTTQEPADETFRKQPLNDNVRVGDTLDYRISGFGNTSNRDMTSFGVTDIVPSELRLEGGSLPAFRNGGGITYNIIYMTNQSGSYRTLHSNVRADQAFSFSAPSLAEGEYITYLTIEFARVPAGFAVGNSFTLRFRVAGGEPGTLIVNRATRVKDNDSNTIDAPGVAIGGLGEGTDTPTTANTELYGMTDAEVPLINKDANGSWALINLLLMLGTCIISMILLIVYFIGKQNQKDNDEQKQTEQEKETLKRKGMWRIFSLIPAVAAVIIFVLTEDITLRMAMIDKWTWLMAAIALVQIVVVVLSKKRHNSKEDNSAQPQNG